jgi:hypothetical protein
VNIFTFLTNKSGLLFIQIVSLAFFITLAYILSVEWARTGRHELRSKLVAVFAAILQIIVSSTVLIFIIFYDVSPSERILPLLTSILTITTIVFLWHAFIYSSIQDLTKINYYIRYVVFFLLGTFSIVLLSWNIFYTDGLIFNKSIWFLVFENFFIFVDIVIIYTISRFKGKYKHRVIIGFIALFFVHLLNVFSFWFPVYPGIILVKSILPIIVPIMFGSVMFKELLDHLVNLNKSLSKSLEGQGELILHIGQIDYKLNSILSYIENKREKNKENLELSELLQGIEEEFTDIKNLLMRVDEEVFEIMLKTAEYDEIMLK